MSRMLDPDRAVIKSVASLTSSGAKTPVPEKGDANISLSTPTARNNLVSNPLGPSPRNVTHFSPPRRIGSALTKSVTADAVSAPSSAEEVIASLRTEVGYLHRKVTYLQSVSTVFRQRIGVMLREAWAEPQSSNPQHQSSDVALAQIEDSYRKIVEEVFSGNPVWAGGAVGDDTAGSTAMTALPPSLNVQNIHEQQLAAYQRFSDIQKAHQLCLVLEERAELKQQLEALRKENEEVRRMCRDRGIYDELKAEKAALEEEVQTLKRRLQVSDEKEVNDMALGKQVVFWKSRASKLKEELAEMRESAGQESEQLQGSILKLTTEVQNLQTKLSTALDERDNVENARKALERSLRSTQVSLDDTQERLDLITSQRAAVTDMESEQEQEHSRVLYKLREDVHEKESTIIGMRTKYNELLEKYDSTSDKARSTEIELESMRNAYHSLEEQCQHYESMFGERQRYASLLTEVQERLDTAVDDLKNSQDCSAISGQLTTVEERLHAIRALEEQLSQKEDVIALKDDEITRLHDQLTALRTGVDGVSEVLLKLPHSVAEVEAMFIELDEYRSADVVGAEEVRQKARLRLLEIEAKREQAHNIAEKLVSTAGRRSQSGGANGVDSERSSPAGGDGALLRATMEALRRVEDDDDDLDIGGAGDDKAAPRLAYRAIMAKKTSAESPVSNHAELQVALRPTQTPIPTVRSSPGQPPQLDDDHVLRAFQLFDAEGTGSIQRDDAVFVLQAVGLDAATQQDVQRAWSALRLPANSFSVSADQTLLLAREVALRHNNTVVAVHVPTTTTPVTGMNQKQNTSVPDADIKLAFDLFVDGAGEYDDADGGSALTHDQAALAFQTLGLHVPAKEALSTKYPEGVTLPDFMSLCRRALVVQA